MTIHSYSAMSTFLQCPRRYEAQYLLKTHKDKPFDATDRGNRIHAEIESYLKGERADIPSETPRDTLLDVLRKAGAKAEVPLAVRHDGTPCDFWATGARLRGKMDVIVSLDGVLIGIDWKTGKRRDNSLQAAVYGYMLSAYYPGQPIRIVFDYLSNGRDPAYHYDTGMKERVENLMEDMETTQVFPPKPSGLCGWCPVNSCEYWRERR